jgi:uncharacterized protein
MRRQRRYAFLGICAGLGLAVMASLSAEGPDLRVLESVKRRDQKAFDLLLRAKADINAAEPDGATALAWAVHLSQRDMAEALLRAGANVNVADSYGETPLTLAAANGDGALIERLLAAGATPDATRWNGETALMLAAGAGSLDGVKALLRLGVDANAAEPRQHQTALMWAAAEGHSDVISGLLKAGAKVDAVSGGGFTPLLFAVVKGDAPSIKTLLAAGADPNHALPNGNTPLMVAVSRQRTLAAMALLEGGANPAARDGLMKNTPLHLAAQAGDVIVAKALLERKADPNARTARTVAAPGRGGGGGFRGGASGEQTPLMLAAASDHEDVMRVLVAAGADPLLRTQDGKNLVMVAAGGGKINTVKYAYELDPHVDLVAEGGATIMHLAVGLGGRTQPEVCEIVQFLADHGAALDELDAGGRTPIARADGIPVDQAIDLLTKLLADRGLEPKIRSKAPTIRSKH